MKILSAIAAIALASSAHASDPPVFSLDWSEYPSWSVFGVAEELGLIKKEEGKLGTIEQKHNVDIVLRNTDYDTCIMSFTNGNSDATCLTNMDSLAPSMSVPSTIILPTSNSYGADMILVDEDSVQSLEDLKGVSVRGLELSVSQYLFERWIETEGGDPLDYTFQNMSPDAAAIALQQDDPNVEAIVVWNPFALQTLNSRQGIRVIGDSRSIENEIIDCVVVSNAALDRDGGDRFAQAIIESFFTVVDRLNGQDRQARDDTLIALGERFSNLGLRDMRQVVRQTRIYNTPEEALVLMTGTDLPETMLNINEFCYRQGMLQEMADVGIVNSTPNTNLFFDPTHLQKFAASE